MKKITLVLVLVAVAIFSNQAFSMEKRPAAKKTAATKTTQEILKITGRVTGYNWSNSTITVSASYGNPLVITIDKNTVISKAKKTLKMADIKSGDYVTVTYEAKKGTNIAKSIIVEDRSSSVPTKSKK
ncbi:MAG: hypothetical protein Q8N72_02845 [Candidatus Omnitrophota bacterium]|nr:hypothetical protein [Candidatus Omnitrophota bacterium]